MTTPEPQSAAPEIERPKFQFTLRTLLLLFVVLGSSLGVYGAWGIVVFGLVVGLTVCMNHLESLWAQIGLAGIMMALMQLHRLLPLPDMLSNGPRISFNWPNIAALLVWLLSVGTLLTYAVRSRKSLSVPPTPS